MLLRPKPIQVVVGHLFKAFIVLCCWFKVNSHENTSMCGWFPFEFCPKDNLLKSIHMSKQYIQICQITNVTRHGYLVVISGKHHVGPCSWPHCSLAAKRAKALLQQCPGHRPRAASGPTKRNVAWTLDLCFFEISFRFFVALAFAVSCSSFSWCFWLFFLIAFPLLFWCVQHVKSCFDFHVVCTILAHVLLKFARFLIVIDVFMLDLVFCRSRCSSFSYAPRIVLLVVCTVLAAHWRRLNFRFV